MGKVVSQEEIARIAERLRQEGKRIVTTNGAFDVLHAGHLAALQDAKRQGDVLVVGLNSDASIRQYKGNGRPLNRQDDRATLLAALNPVDFVVVFNETDPREFIRIVKPHVHAKAGDYDAEKMIETPVVREHGGDIVITRYQQGYSTTGTLFRAAQEYAPILDAFRNKCVLVIGDVMLDAYVWGEVSRINPEAPVPVVDVTEETFSPGGAANVAANIAALCGSPILLGVVGNDQNKSLLEAALRKQGVTAWLETDEQRPTTVKTRVMAQRQQLLRFDGESCEPIGKSLEGRLCAILGGHDANACAVSDYAKGVITQGVYAAIREYAEQKGIPLIVDPKPGSAVDYAGASILKLNHKEACQFVGVTETNDDAAIADAGRKLVEQYQARIIITRAEKGVSVFDTNGGVNSIVNNVKKNEVFDVSGAGDTFLAALTLAYASSATLVQAAEIANRTAGIKLGKVGAVPVSLDELRKEYTYA